MMRDDKRKLDTAVLGSMKGISAKERPKCREVIIRDSLRPFIDECLGFWNGFQALQPNGMKIFLSVGLRRQMGKMLREGFWPELLDAEMNAQAKEARHEYQRLGRIAGRVL